MYEDCPCHPEWPKNHVPVVAEAFSLQLSHFYTMLLCLTNVLWESWGWGIVPKCPVTQNCPYGLTDRGVAFWIKWVAVWMNGLKKQERSNPLRYGMHSLGEPDLFVKRSFQGPVCVLGQGEGGGRGVEEFIVFKILIIRCREMQMAG